MSSATPFVVGFEIALSAAGLIALVRYARPGRARRSGPNSPLPAWDVEPLQLLLLLCLVTFGAVLFAVLAGATVKHFGLTGDPATIVAGAAAQFGMLGAALAFAFTVPSFRTRVRLSVQSIAGSGAVTFAICVPLLYATGGAWEFILERFGLPAEKQDLIRMFAEARSPVFLGALTLLAVVIAPVTEELIFRAGLFRFLRTRTPRWLAILLPALIFAALHVNWQTMEGFASFAPLVVLAVLFSLAYEHTGNIGTTMVAHALFNLNTIVVILSGLSGT